MDEKTNEFREYRKEPGTRENMLRTGRLLFFAKNNIPQKIALLRKICEEGVGSLDCSLDANEPNRIDHVGSSEFL